MTRKRHCYGPAPEIRGTVHDYWIQRREQRLRHPRKRASTHSSKQAANSDPPAASIERVHKHTHLQVSDRADHIKHVSDLINGLHSTSFAGSPSGPLPPSPKPSDKKAGYYPLTVAGAAADLISEPLGLLSHCVPYYPREGPHRRGPSLTRVSFQIKLGCRGY